MEGKQTYVTLKEASAQLGVHPNTLRNWEQRGIIHLTRLPGSRYRRVPRAEVERLVNDMRAALPSTVSERWLESGCVLLMLPPADDPACLAAAEALAEEVKSELARATPQGTLEEAMQALRGASWSS
jgi:excisionase family DNA binding protein